MNISTSTRHLAQGFLVLFFTLASVAGVRAQCSDFISFPPGPVVINLTLNAGGSVNLNNAVLNANGFTKNAACDFWLSTDPDPLNLGAYNNTPINFTCADVATSPQTWYVRVGGLPLIADDMGPGATVVPITINVIDNIPPTITCIGNQVRPADGVCTYTTVGAEFDWVTANDNCATNITYALTGATLGTGGSTLAGVVFGSGVTTVTWTVADNALPTANTATCSFTVTVNDVSAPTITCPANVVAPNAPANGVCQWVGTGLEVTNAMVADNCATDAALLGTLTNSITGPGNLNGYNFPLGVSNVTYTINDGVNPSVNCMFSVDVTDQTNPVITCPANITVNALGSPDCNYTVAGTGFDATASDNCSIMAGTPVNDYNASTTLNAAVFNVGTTNVEWSVTDGSGNVATCAFSVTVEDVTAPTIVALPPGVVTFQDIFNVSTSPGSCSQSVSWYRPSVLTHTATDCSGSVTLTENATVAINCPGLDCVNDPNFFTDNGVTPYPYDETNPLHWVTPVSAEFPVGTTVISYDFEDAFGNITTITVTVNVAETENPDANCVTGPVSIALDPLLNAAVVTPGLINNGSTDNCGIQGLAVTPSIFDCTQLGTQNVTLTVTDNAGNTDECTTTVFVSDNTLPVIGCPSSFVVAANANCNATVPGLIFNVGPSSPAVLEYYDNALDPCGLNFQYSVNGGAFNNLGLFVSNPVDLSAVVFTAGNNSVILRATDGSGNIAVCNFTVSVQDQTPPTYAAGVNPGPVPGSTIMANVPNIGSCSSKAIWDTPLFSDNCPGAVTIVSQSAFSDVTIFSADNGGITPVTYVVRDVAGNLYTYTFNVLALDNQAPVANCKDITVNLSPAIGAGSVVVTPAMIDDTSTDNCGYSYVSGNVTYSCANLGANNYTLQIKDDANNMASCVGVVTVVDVTAPTFTCPANVTVNANATCVATVTGTASATDNCSVTKYEYDLNPPSAGFVLLNNGATGNLANIPALPLGVTTVTLRASDISNNSSTCTFTVTVQDVTPPVFAGVPANTTVACNAIPPIVNPTATDNCGTANVVFAGQTFTAGCTYTITRTWVASDDAVPANTVSVSQVITVQDIVGPVFNPAFIPSGTVNINVAGALVCTGNYTLNVTDITDILDACGDVSGIAYSLVPASGAPSAGVLTFAAGVYTLPVSSFPIGTSVVTLTATDDCGNPTTKVINIIVTDNQAPVFQNAYAAAPAGRCGQVYTLPNTTNNCDQLFTWSRPVLGDITDCGNFTVTESISNQTVQSFVNLLNPFGPAFPPASPGVIAQFPVGETTVTYTATQGANVSTCSFIVKIVDTQAPVITCPADQNLSISSACSAAATVPTYPAASIADNCPNNVSVSQSPAPGTLVSNVVPVIPGNTFQVTLQAMDNFPNNLMSVPCTFTVTLLDGQSPVPLITSLPDIVSNCTKDTVVAPGATDCNGVSIDTIWGTPSVAVMMILPPAYPGGPPSYVLNPGNYVITWSYSDPQNNTTTQPQNVFITVDNTPPVAIAQALNVNLNAMGTAFVTAVQLNNGSFDQDNCGPIDLSIQTGVGPNFVYVDTLNLDCSNLANMGVNTVVFAVTDINGNVSTFQTTVTVFDVTAPTFVNPWTAGQMDTVIQACQPVPVAADFPQTAADQCDLVVNIALTETSTQDTVGCAKYSYVINRRWTATDDSGNATLRTQRIVVTDTQAPVFAANTPLTATFNTAPNAFMCNAAVNFNMADFVSDCQDSADVTITNTLISAPMGNTFVIPAGGNISAANYPVGTYVVRFTATDNCGNSSTYDLTIDVVDTTPPTAVCINGVSASLQPSGTVTVTFNQFNNNSYDNCSSTLDLLIQRLDQNPLETPTPSLEYNCDDADGVTEHPVKLFVTDGVGNMSMCLTYIVIQDNVAPVITCPANITLDCAANTAPQVLGFATAVDNCPNNVTIDFTDSLDVGSGNVCELLTRVWSAMDLANNISTCAQLISLQDTTKPVLSAYPPDETISCSVPLPAPATITATDNCSAVVVVQFAQDTINIAQGPCGQFTYTIVRTRTAVDDCGNTEVHTRLINVEDVTAPEFAGMPDTIILNTSQFPPNATCTVPWNFNVGQFLEDCSPDSIMVVTNDGPFGDGELDLSGNYPIGSYFVKFEATDACGNIGKDSLVIIVQDNSVPTLVCNNNVVIALGTNGDATISAMDIDLGSTDNCAIDTLVLSQSTFDCADLGVQTISLTATDIYGNTNSCVVDVEVTLGVNAGFALTVSGTPETFFGAGDGTATAVATGGTGLFSYLWSNATMDTTSMVNGLDAGVYTVSVTDVNSGCFFVDTVVIDAGAIITITVGTADACQGETLSIPVTVDNFIQVSGFSFGLDLDNIVAGAITGISNLNPAFAGAIVGVNSVFWTHPTLDSIDLPNGTVLFNLEVTLSNAAQGTTSAIVESAIPALVFLQNGTIQAPMVNFNNGSVTISCTANDLEIAGDVFTWKLPTLPIPGVDVTLGGTNNGLDVTALPGAEYSFLVPTGSNTLVSASKIATIKNQQINVGDMLGIQAHAAQQVSFTSPYQWVAADINGDQRVNLADYAFVQKYVLTNNAHFTDPQGNQVGPDWKFIPESFMFMPLPNGNPQAPLPNPLNNPIPLSTIARAGVMMDFLDDDFVGVLMGDVNGSVVPNFTSGGGAEFGEVLKFRLDDRAIQAGEIVTIPFKSVDFTNAQAYQMTIAFDPTVFELQDIQPGILPGLTENDFGTNYLADGLLTTLWVGGKPMSFDDNETLFTLTFKALANVPALSGVLHSSSDITEALAIDQAGNSKSVDFEFVSSVSTGEVESKVFALYQNQPNPFTSVTTISFRLPESGRATLRVFSAEGRLVKTVIGEFAEGINAIQFRKDDIGSNGVFYYELETPKHSDRKKMILID
jgi:hypothetical protein